MNRHFPILAVAVVLVSVAGRGWTSTNNPTGLLLLTMR